MAILDDAQYAFLGANADELVGIVVAFECFGRVALLSLDRQRVDFGRFAVRRAAAVLLL